MRADGPSGWTAADRSRRTAPNGPSALTSYDARMPRSPRRHTVFERLGGFVVRKPAPASVSLTVTVSADSASLICAYSFTPTDDMPPRDDRIHILFVDEGRETLLMKHNGTGKAFASCDDLSEFLLIPVLTGRPR